METRKKVSLLLFLWGLILAILPLTGHRSFTIKPDSLLKKTLDPEVSFSVDEIAKFIVNEDSTVRLIDLRPHDEFSKENIPGSVNVPYDRFISEDPDMYLNERGIKVILYSNDDYDSNYALVYCRGLGYDNASLVSERFFSKTL
jgi:rhodanese-related sulfurtransferase